MAEPKQSFSYKPLNHDIKEIRLLTVHHHHSPADDPSTTATATADIISCSLAHASLDEQPTYTALSYVWGDPAAPLTIQLDGHEVHVTRNLHTALRRLCRLPQDTVIWIDALCINQADNAEKAVQVQLMGSIYSAANQTYIWLGEDEEDRAGSRGLHQIRDLGVYFRQMRQAPGFDNAKILAFVKTVRSFAEDSSPEEDRKAEDVAQAEVKKHDSKGRFDFTAIWKFFRQRPWWRRVWIIQEVALAHTAFVLCGDHSASWEDVSEGIQVLEWMVLYSSSETRHRRLHIMLGDIYNYVSHIKFVSEAVKRARVASKASNEARDTGVSLMEMLMWTMAGVDSGDTGIQATDPRDRIYGLLGPVREEDKRKIPVDYSADSTISTILFAVGKAALEQYGPDIFSYCRATSLSASLPSWAPDFTAPRVPMIGEVKLTDDYDSKFNAASGLEWHPKLLNATFQEPFIDLKGKVVARVKEVGSEFATSPDEASYIEDCKAWLVELDALVTNANAKPEDDASEVRPPLSELKNNLWRVPATDVGLVKRANEEGYYTERFRHGYGVLTGSIEPPPELEDAGRSTWRLSESWDYRRIWKIYNRRAFVDAQGRPGLGPKEIRAGDSIVIFVGGHVPFVVRLEQSGVHRLIGAVYLYNTMDGEALSLNDETSSILLK